jgi:hypothetical protein
MYKVEESKEILRGMIPCYTLQEIHLGSQLRFLFSLSFDISLSLGQISASQCNK